MKARLGLHAVAAAPVACECCGVAVTAIGGRGVCVTLTDCDVRGELTIYVCVRCALASDDRDVVLVARRAEDASS
jgi:hypothetical protein